MSKELQKYDPVAAARRIDEALAGLRGASEKAPPALVDPFGSQQQEIYDWQAEAAKPGAFEMDEMQSEVLTKDKNGMIRAERTIRRRVRKG